MNTEKPSNADKHGGIDLADAYLRSLDMPSYTQVVEYLREAVKLMPRTGGEQIIWRGRIEFALAHVPAPRYWVMNGRGQYYSSRDTKPSWAFDVSQATVMTQESAAEIARREGATAVPIV